MNKLRISLKKIIFPTILVIFVLIVLFFYIKSINYYNGSKQAATKIARYIMMVALEKVETEKADKIIGYLNSEPTDEVNFNIINNPFKKIEEIEKIEVEAEE